MSTIKNLQPEPRIEHWHDPVPSRFVASERKHVTLLAGGLTFAHDRLLQAGMRGLGYNFQALDTPDAKSLNLGKEFGNRGQCNPTYFTVGNLIKYLSHLRDEQGIATDDIIKNYAFVTTSSCGPCRFGMYSTEYRKALRDAGFDGFRVMQIQQSEVKNVSGEASGLEINTKFVLTLLRAAIAGDVLNALSYRIRPYELEEGTTDRVIDNCQAMVCEALENGKSVLRALWKCRRALKKIKVDRSQVKPKVSIIGEFWAMTTEGDGNYRLQRFLESEGAEVDIQLLTAWFLYLVWELRYDTRRREVLRGTDGGKAGLDGIDSRSRRFYLWLANRLIRSSFWVFSRVAGLGKYELADMDELAEVSHEYYDNHLRGGEGHMEVAKLILNTKKKKANMTISVKPFGCMPSSGVSDGVQSLILERFPGTIFLPIETTGDGAVNVYSRIQMQLFKAKRIARQETTEALAAYGIDMEDVQEYLRRNPGYNLSLHKSPHRAASTNVDLIHEIGPKIRGKGSRKLQTSAG